ncbi:hypothetical protein B9G55_17895 [Saccharibacillus sp. O16]|nr:hypothetical protein B9G55_17895 [Saccharibacillus sp. O16]
MYNPSSTDYYSGREPWIRDKKRFRLALIVSTVLALLSIRYPGTRPLYEEALLAIHLPVSLPLPGGGQLTYSGLIFLGIGLWALFLIWDSLNRHRIVLCLALIWLLPMLAKAALAGYQALIPSGVYAVSIDQDQTRCQYQFQAGKATGSCLLIVTNHSRGSTNIEPTVQLDLSSSAEQQPVAASLGSISLGSRETRDYSLDFSVDLPKPTDPSMTGSGYAGLSVSGRGLVLTMDDGKRSRTWGD